jgi:hypothetical protein
MRKIEGLNIVKMKKFFLMTIIGVLFMSCSQFSLRNSEENIKEDILKLTPIGSSMNEVIEVINNNKNWQILSNGTWKQWSSLSEYEIQQQKDNITRIKTIRVLLGRWLMQNVSAGWELDENGIVIDVNIRKTMAK